MARDGKQSPACPAREGRGPIGAGPAPNRVLRTWTMFRGEPQATPSVSPETGDQQTATAPSLRPGDRARSAALPATTSPAWARRPQLRQCDCLCRGRRTTTSTLSRVPGQAGAGGTSTPPAAGGASITHLRLFGGRVYSAPHRPGTDIRGEPARRRAEVARSEPGETGSGRPVVLSTAPEGQDPWSTDGHQFPGRRHGAGGGVAIHGPGSRPRLACTKGTGEFTPAFAGTAPGWVPGRSPALRRWGSKNPPLLLVFRQQGPRSTPFNADQKANTGQAWCGAFQDEQT